MRVTPLAAIVGATSVVLACNAIVGVQDVAPRDTSSTRDAGKGASSTSSSGSSGIDGTPTEATDSGAKPPEAGRPQCDGDVDCERVIFVTKGAFNGKLGGLSGADQKCFEAAKANPALAGRPFRAWLSDSTGSAAGRVPHGTKPFRRTDGTIVATSYTDLTDKTLSLPPVLDETGQMLPGPTFSRSVWTGTSPAGTSNNIHCNDWSSDTVTASGGFGYADQTDETWTELLDTDTGNPATYSCNADNHLYCVEY